MAKARVRLKLRGINQVMASPGTQSLVDERARRIAEAAGEGFEAKSAPHRWTARAYVYTDTAAARRREADDKVLNRALSAGMG